MQITEGVRLKQELARSVCHGILTSLQLLEKLVHNMELMVITAFVEIQMGMNRQFGATLVIQRILQSSCVILLDLLKQINV